MNIFEKEPPNNLEAERLVIGSMLLGNKDSIVTSLSMLKPDDFYSPTHEQIFMAIKTLFTKNYSINLVSVQDALTFSIPCSRMNKLLTKRSHASHS